MTPEIIVDGYNLIHRASDLRRFLPDNLERARNEVILKISNFRRNKKLKITVVFDGNRVGQPSKTRQGAIEIVYAIPPKSADDIIKLLVQKSKNPQNITVISSDNGIKGFVRTCRANVMNSEDFYRKYLIIEEKFESSEQDTNMSKDELREWLDLFNRNQDRK